VPNPDIMRAKSRGIDIGQGTAGVEELVTDGSKSRQGSALNEPYRAGRLEVPLLQPRHT
jgi:hypothetical protein